MCSFFFLLVCLFAPDELASALKSRACAFRRGGKYAMRITSCLSLASYCIKPFSRSFSYVATNGMIYQINITGVAKKAHKQCCPWGGDTVSN